MGKTYKDIGEEYREDKQNSRCFRQMKEFRKSRNSNNRLRCGNTGKVGFANKDDAQKRADEILATGSRDGISTFRIYECEWCKHYHLTKTADYN